MGVEDLEARLVVLAIEFGQEIASPWTSDADKCRLRAARRALDDAQAALLPGAPEPAPDTASGARITFSPALDPIYRRKQTRMRCNHCRAEWWYTPGTRIAASAHRRPDGRICRKTIDATSLEPLPKGVR